MCARTHMHAHVHVIASKRACVCARSHVCAHTCASAREIVCDDACRARVGTRGDTCTWAARRAARLVASDTRMPELSSLQLWLAAPAAPRCMSAGVAAARRVIVATTARLTTAATPATLASVVLRSVTAATTGTTTTSATTTAPRWHNNHQLAHAACHMTYTARRLPLLTRNTPHGSRRTTHTACGTRQTNTWLAVCVDQLTVEAMNLATRGVQHTS